MTATTDVTTPAADGRAGAGPILLVTSSTRTYHPRHYQLFARSLVEAGLPAVVVGQPVDAPGEVKPVPVRFLPKRSGRLSRMLSGPDVMVRALRMRPAVLQVNSLELLPWAALARLVVRRPMIYDSNEDYASYMLLKRYLPAWLRVPLSRIVGVLEPWLSARLDATLVADEAGLERFEQRTGKRPLLVHNFPWLSFTEAPASGEFKYDATYNGTLPTYHVDAMAETARILRDRGVPARFCLAAREYGAEDQRELEERLEREGVRHMFTLLYNLPFAQMPQLIADSRMGFIPLPDVPKFRSNIPRKLFEFMSLGRPCVLSDLPPSRRLIGDADCSLLVPHDPRAYADAIQALIEDPERADAMGRRGRTLVLERMNAEAAVGPYVELIERLAGASSRA